MLSHHALQNGSPKIHETEEDPPSPPPPPLAPQFQSFWHSRASILSVFSVAPFLHATICLQQSAKHMSVYRLTNPIFLFLVRWFYQAYLFNSRKNKKTRKTRQPPVRDHLHTSHKSLSLHAWFLVSLDLKNQAVAFFFFPLTLKCDSWGAQGAYLWQCRVIIALCQQLSHS